MTSTSKPSFDYHSPWFLWHSSKWSPYIHSCSLMLFFSTSIKVIVQKIHILLVICFIIQCLMIYIRIKIKLFKCPTKPFIFFHMFNSSTISWSTANLYSFILSNKNYFSSYNEPGYFLFLSLCAWFILLGSLFAPFSCLTLANLFPTLDIVIKRNFLWPLRMG